MDWWMIFFRVVHVGSAMVWFGGAIVGAFFLAPTAAALGKAGQPFMDHLMRRRGLGVLFPIVAALTVLAGAALYWRDSDGLQSTWVTSPTGLAFAIGGIAAIVSFALGFIRSRRASPSRRPSATSCGRRSRTPSSARGWSGPID